MNGGMIRYYILSLLHAIYLVKLLREDIIASTIEGVDEEVTNVVVGNDAMRDEEEERFVGDGGVKSIMIQDHHHAVGKIQDNKTF